jgi:hypothetical protein
MRIGQPRSEETPSLPFASPARSPSLLRSSMERVHDPSRSSPDQLPQHVLRPSTNNEGESSFQPQAVLQPRRPESICSYMSATSALDDDDPEVRLSLHDAGLVLTIRREGMWDDGLVAPSRPCPCPSLVRAGTTYHMLITVIPLLWYLLPHTFRPYSPNRQTMLSPRRLA